MMKSENSKKVKFSFWEIIKLIGFFTCIFFVGVAKVLRDYFSGCWGAKNSGSFFCSSSVRRDKENKK